MPKERYGSKIVINYDMELGADMPSSEVQNVRDRTGMVGRATEIETLSRAWFPFRDFLSVLKLGIQYIRRTAPNVETGEMVVGVNLSLREDFKR